MSRFGIPAAIAGIILILSGIAHGLRSDRWGHHPDALAAVKKLNDIPATIGQWHSSELPIAQRELKMAGAMGHLSRKYINLDDGRAVHLMILCGRHGPISVHPPTVCFVSAGWNLNTAPVKHNFNSGTHQQNKEFWMADFEKNSAVTKQITRTFWGWSVSGNWQAAAYPRIQYADSPFLFKIYLSYGLHEAGEPIEKPTKEFLEQLLSEIDHALFDGGVDL